MKTRPSVPRTVNPKVVNARAMWQCNSPITIEPYLATREEGKRAKRIFVIPATRAAYDQMVEQMASATVYRERLAGAGYVGDSHAVGKDMAIAALRAIGISRPL
jgi:hypothetical protein